jgi:hypothetical protein
MNTKTTQTYRRSDLFDQMKNPAFYPHPADTVISVETHISNVFLAGDVVYKIKKPLNLGFVDYDSLDKRRFFCEREVALNRRLTRDVYLGVIPITCRNGHYRLEGSGTPVEYAVAMRRLSERCSLKNLANTLGGTAIRELAIIVSDFHENSVVENPPSRQETWDRLSGHCLENFSQAEARAGHPFDRDDFERVRFRTREILDRDRPFFLRRMKDGRFRDGHGDLRCGHVYVTDQGIQILDCIEFNDALRYLDVASDVAFLVMDLEFLGHGGLAGQFLGDYVARGMDVGVYRFIDFYKAYRAMVRLKVDLIRMGAEDLPASEKTGLAAHIVRYFRLADCFTETAYRPKLWVVCGLPASGKSTVASGLAGAMMAGLIRSDAVRKSLFGPSGRDPSDQPFETGIYGNPATETTYDRMMAQARKILNRGHSVILDATFRARRHREAARDLAANAGADLVVVECRADREVRRARLHRREGREDLLSDARIIHQMPFEKRYEPLDEIDDESHIVVNTDMVPDVCLRRILSDVYTRSQKGLLCIP